MTNHPFALAVASCASVLGLAFSLSLAPPAMAANLTTSADSPDVSLAMPIMSPERGKVLYASKGCVVCHAINGVGGTDAPDISATAMQPGMNPFELVAKMWNHSQGMIAMQESELGEQITFENGQQIADIVAFLHDADEQASFSEQDIPDNIKDLMHADEDAH